MVTSPPHAQERHPKATAAGISKPPVPTLDLKDMSSKNPVIQERPGRQLKLPPMKHPAQTKPNFEPPKENQPNNVLRPLTMEPAKERSDETSLSLEISKTRFASGEFNDITQSELKAMHTLNKKL